MNIDRARVLLEEMRRLRRMLASEKDSTQYAAVVTVLDRLGDAWPDLAEAYIRRVEHVESSRGIAALNREDS